MQSGVDEDELLDDCRSGWMVVERDFSASLAKPEQLRYALQCMGRNPSGKAIERYWYQCGGKMSFQQFSVVMKKEARVTMGDLMNCFRRIDSTGGGSVMALLTKHGEKMTREELQSILDDIDPEGTGKLDYAELSHVLMRVAEECSKAYKARGARLLELAAKGRSQSEGRSLGTKRKASEGRRKGTPQAHGRRSEEERTNEHSQAVKTTSAPVVRARRSGHRDPTPEARWSGHRDPTPEARRSRHRDPTPEARRSRHRDPTPEQKGARHASRHLDTPPRHRDHTTKHSSQKHRGSSKDLPRHSVPRTSSHPLVVLDNIDAQGHAATPIIPLSHPTQSSRNQPNPQKESITLEPIYVPSNKAQEQVSHSSNKAQEQVSHPSNKAQEQVSHPSDKTQEQVSHPSNKAQEQVSHPSDKAQEQVSLPSNKAQEQVSHPSDKTQEQVSHPSDKAQEQVSHPSDKAQEQVSHPSNKAQEQVSHPSDKAQEQASLPVGSLATNTADVLSSDTPSMSEQHSTAQPRPQSTAQPSKTHSDEHYLTKVLPEIECSTHLPPVITKSRLPLLVLDPPPVPLTSSPLVSADGQVPPKADPSISHQDAEGTSSAPPTSPSTPPKSAVTPPTTMSAVISMALSVREANENESPLPPETPSMLSDIPSTPEEELEESVESGEEEALPWKEPLPQASVEPFVSKYPAGQQLLKPPANLDSWNTITAKGCFYGDLNEGDDVLCVSCQQYCLNLPVASKLCFEISPISPGNHSTDMLLFVFHVDGEERPTQPITHTQYQYGQRHICQVDLDQGSYALVPFTSGCHQRPDEEQEYPVPLVVQEGEKVTLTQRCKEALEEIFHRIDLDGNGSVSRTEFDFFQERTSGEMCDDDAWKVIQENFELTEEDELTLKGFIDLHIMTAEDPEGGERELWVVMAALGYSQQLLLNQACPFQFNVSTESCEPEIEIVEMCFVSSVIDPMICQLASAKGVCEKVKDGGDDLKTYSYSIGQLTSIVLENKGSKHASVQLDCSRSTNVVINRESSVHVMDIEPNCAVVGFYLVPQDPEKACSVSCVACRILS